MQDIQIVNECYSNPLKAEFTHFRIQSVVERIYPNKDNNYTERLYDPSQLTETEDCIINTFYTVYGVGKLRLYKAIYDCKNLETARNLLTQIFGVNLKDIDRDKKWVVIPLK